MAYFYVKSTGTAAVSTDAGRETVQRTGTWNADTADSYPSVDVAEGATTPPAAGDFICISSSSAYTSSSANIVYSGVVGKGYTVICVDDANQENAAIATSYLETCSGVYDVYIGSTEFSTMFLYGHWLRSTDNILLANGDGSTLTCVECTFEVTGSGDIIVGANGEGAETTLINCDLNFGLSSGVFYGATKGCRFTMIGGDGSSGAGARTIFREGGLSAGGGTETYIGVDLSSYDDLVEFSNTVQDDCLITFKRCNVKSTVDVIDASLTLKWGQRVEVYNCAHDASAEYQFGVYEEECIAQSDTSIYRDSSIAFPEQNQKVSIKVTTSANVSISRPFSFELPTLYAALSSTSTDLIRIFLLTGDTIDDGDVFALAIYPDGTSKHINNIEVSSTLTNVADAFDPFRTPGSLGTNTESWTGRTSENRYQLDIDTSGDAGADCVPIIKVFVTKQFSANPLYICVTPELS